MEAGKQKPFKKMGTFSSMLLEKDPDQLPHKQGPPASSASRIPASQHPGLLASRHPAPPDFFPLDFPGMIRYFPDQFCARSPGDRASASGAEDRRFESCRAYHQSLAFPSVSPSSSRIDSIFIEPASKRFTSPFYKFYGEPLARGLIVGYGSDGACLPLPSCSSCSSWLNPIVL